MSRQGIVTVLIFGLLLTSAACGTSAPPDTPIERPPLASPPDPGPPPDRHDLSEDQQTAAAQATVGVSGIACGRQVTGTGFAVAGDLIATSAHVIVGIDVIEVDTTDGRSFEAAVIAFDPISDLALLHVSDLGLEPLPLGLAADGTVGALFGWDPGALTAVSKPFRIDRPITVKIEMVAGTETVRRPSWLVAATITRGDSGGPLVTADGRVVGVAFATSTAGGTASYAVRASELEKLMANDPDEPVVVPDC